MSRPNLFWSFSILWLLAIHLSTASAAEEREATDEESRDAIQWILGLRSEVVVEFHHGVQATLRHGSSIPNGGYKIRSIAISRPVSVDPPARPGVADRDLRALQAIHSLRRIAIESDAFTGTGLEEIGALDQCDDLWLSGVHLTTGGLGCINRMPNLRRLHLRGEAVSDEAIRTLTAPMLEVLELAGTSVSIDSLSGPNRFPALKSLALSTDSARPGSWHVLKGIAGLRELTVECDGHTPFAGLISRIGETSGLTHLTLRAAHPKMSRPTGRVELPATVTHLTLDGMPEGILLGLDGNHQLLELNVRLELLSVKTVEAIGKCRNLRRLTIDAERAPDSSVGRLPPMPELREFSCLVWRDGVGREGGRALASMPALHSLVLDGPHQFNDVLSEVATVMRLRELSVSAEELESPVLKHISRMAGLHALEINCNGPTTEEYVAMLRQLPALRRLRMNHEFAPSEAARALEPMQSMQATSMVISACTSEALRSLHSLSRLSRCHLSLLHPRVDATIAKELSALSGVSDVSLDVHIADGDVYSEFVNGFGNGRLVLSVEPVDPARRRVERP